MTTESCRVTFRPIRVGWVVPRDREALELAFSNSLALWGGLYNPVLLADAHEQSDRLAYEFGVDVLASPDTSQASNTGLRAEKYLRWPFLDDPLLSADIVGARVLDIRHSALQAQDARRRQLIEPTTKFYDISWDKADPLSTVFSAMFGALPTGDDRQIQYRRFASERAAAVPAHIAHGQPVSAQLLNLPLATALSSWGTMVSRWVGGPGIFLGDAGSITDIVSFWNIRASGVDLVFFDPAYRERLTPLAQALAQDVAAHRAKSGQLGAELTAWSNRAFTPNDLPHLGSDVSWRNELPQEGRLPHPEFSNTHAVASIGTGAAGLEATVSLTKKPHIDSAWSSGQHLVASIAFGRLYGHQGMTLSPAFAPELNEVYGHATHVGFAYCRSEPASLGIIVRAADDHVTMTAMENDDAVQHVFRACDLEANVSQAGRIARRLEQQMGGLQGCRVFKIPGVRQLLREYAGSKAFTRSVAIQQVRQNHGGKATFSEHEDLYIERRPAGTKLTPDDVFTYLLKKDVFRPGVELLCPRCELTDWFLLDDLKTRVDCRLCGHGYHVPPQIPGAQFTYRSSGLFQRFERLEGAIPVLVLLQQLDIALGVDRAAFSTSMTVQWRTGESCETDFVWISSQECGRPDIAIGECKTRGPVDEQDVKNLDRLATTLRGRGFRVFVVIAKLSDFSQAEVEACRRLRPHVVMLSARELEPYEIWPGEQIPGPFVRGFERLAALTAQKYFADT